MAPSHASQTPLKTATNDTRNASINATIEISSPTAVEADTSLFALNASWSGTNSNAVESAEATSRMKRIQTGVETSNREPSNGFQLRVTTFTPASRISPTESGRSVGDATAANLAG